MPGGFDTTDGSNGYETVRPIGSEDREFTSECNVLLTNDETLAFRVEFRDGDVLMRFTRHHIVDELERLAHVDAATVARMHDLAEHAVPFFEWPDDLLTVEQQEIVRADRDPDNFSREYGETREAFFAYQDADAYYHICTFPEFLHDWWRASLSHANRERMQDYEERRIVYKRTGVRI